MTEWLYDSQSKDTAFKSIMVMSRLLLQKSTQKSKSKDHSRVLETRIEFWASGETMDLLKEVETIQRGLRITKNHQQQQKYKKTYP